MENVLGEVKSIDVQEETIWCKRRQVPGVRSSHPLEPDHQSLAAVGQNHDAAIEGLCPPADVDPGKGLDPRDQ
jgi:hypothetical protein